MYLHLCIHLYVCVCLTCTLAANQIFALRFIRVNGCDSHIIQSVWVQVWENIRRLLTPQDSLERDTQILVLETQRTRQLLSQAPILICIILLLS